MEGTPTDRVVMDTGDVVPIIRVSGSAYERGVQRGEQIPEMIHSRVDRVIAGYTDIGSKEEVQAVAATVERATNDRSPWIIDELRGIAHGANVDWDNLRMAVFGRTVQNAMRLREQVHDQVEDCSCFVATKTATSDHHLLMAKNADLSPPLLDKQDLLIMEVVPDEGYNYVAAGYFPERPTQPEGMNEHGLTVIGSGQAPKDGAYAYEQGYPVGVPVHHLQALLYTECAYISEALTLLSEQPRGYYGRVMFLGDRTGSWAKIEITYDAMHVQYAEPDATYPANFVAAGVSGVFSGPDTNPLITNRSERPSAYIRYDRSMNLLIQEAGRIDFEFATQLLRDHDGAPSSASICKHGDGHTLGAVIFKPEETKGWIVNGRPCEAGEFKELDLTLLKQSDAAQLPV